MSSTEQTTDKRPTAFISWAHGDETWERTVLDFATAMRVVGGVDVDLDLWHSTDNENWTTYGPTGIRDSDFVLITVDEAYRQRWEGTNDASVGAGAAREAAAIKAIFDRDQNEFRRRVKVVVLPGACKGDIPDELFGGAERFEVSDFDASGLEALLRSLYSKPLDNKPPLGPAPPLPPRYLAEVQEATAAAASEAPQAPSTPDSDEDVLKTRIAQIAAWIRDNFNAVQAGDRAQLEHEQAELQASLEALVRSAASYGGAEQLDARAEEDSPAVTTETVSAEPSAQPSIAGLQPAEEQTSVRLHDDLLKLLREKDTIGVDVLLRSERRDFEKAFEAFVRTPHEIPTMEDAKEVHTELLPLLERRLASWLPLVAHDEELWRAEIEALIDWRNREPLRNGYTFWYAIAEWAVWWLGYAVGAAAVRGRWWSALDPLLRANVRNPYGGQSPLVQSVPGEAGDAIGKATLSEGFRPAPWWDSLKTDLLGSPVLEGCYPELIDPEDQLVASLSAFDLLMSISLGAAGHIAAAHWAWQSEGGKRLALQLHGEGKLRDQIAEAVGLSTDEFIESAATALKNAVSLPQTFPDRGAIGLLLNGTER